MIYRTYLTMSNRIHKEDRASQQEILKEASLPVNKKRSSRTASLIESGLLDSNQRPRAPQTCALPTALNPDP